MPAVPNPVFGADELDYELWDGDEVVKGQPTPRHEAVRAGLIGQLVAQVGDELVVVVSSALEDSGTAPRSDGSVLDVATRETLIWIEVVSAADLRQGDDRLVGGRRRRWLFDHGVRAIWALSDILGGITLNVLSPSGSVKVFAAPSTPTIDVAGASRVHRFVIDLGRLEAAASAAGLD